MQDIDSILREDRVFPPPAAFQESARIASVDVYQAMWDRADQDPEAFWGEIAEREFVWDQKWHTTLEWDLPFAKWFVGGKTNISVNCVDRHAHSDRRNRAAIIWEGEPGDTRTLTYQQLYREVCRFSNVLTNLGIEEGDRVAIYMPMVPEIAVAMLACARIGACHSIIFGGFSANSIRDRVNDAQCKAVITADGGYRRGNVLALKPVVDEALEGCPTVQSVVVYRRTDNAVTMTPGRDHWWHDLMAVAEDRHQAPSLDAETPLFILYTSGTTGKPKGVLHTTGGYMVGTTMTSRWVFDLKDSDTFWCTADCGWITGHSYVVYGILSNGATTFMYEGAPDWPEPDRFWDIIDRHDITILYTAPTAIRACMSWGDEWPQRHDLSSLRLLGTVGEPINPEAWMWYHDMIGKGRCPIVDTWWQTETGGIMISPIPGVTPTKPGSATTPLPGVVADVVDKDGNPVAENKGGFLVIKKPWPHMLRTLWGDSDRYKEAYWSQIPGSYFAGDGARRDEDGYFWIMGRIDDVINVSGHRLGTMEVESALVSHPLVTEAACVGMPHHIKGQVIAAFVTLEGGKDGSGALVSELRDHVAKEIGSIAKPEMIRFTPVLPKTRSGKIMRRLLADIAAGREPSGDTTTLADPTVIDKLMGR
jgi:acetyl-CoA synthetase